MQDVSCEPLVLCRLRILKQAWIFSVSHTITPSRSCIHRKAINKDKPSLSSGVLPSRQHLWYAIYTEGVAPGYSG